MDNKRVVVTGLGIISPNSGIGKDSFSEAIFNGISGIKPISLFDTSAFKVHTAAEIQDFRAQEILGPEGLRVLDRSARLLCSATLLALQDAGIEIKEDNSRNIGLVAGNTLGSLKSICDFDKVAIKDGPQYVNPSLFPNTVINAQVSHACIRLNIKGFNATISTGFSASLDAINYALNFIKLGRKNIILAGGVEELCMETFLGFHKIGLLAGIKKGSVELSCPFDKRRNGIILGEGSCVLMLEDLESALERNAHIYAEIKGYGTCFEACRPGQHNLGAAGLKEAMQSALKKAKIKPQEIDYICSGANSTVNSDAMEAKCIKEVFADSFNSLQVSSLKSMIGESFSASGALQVAAAVLAIERQMIPPTINYEEKDESCDLSYVTQARACRVNNAIVNAFGLGSGNSSLIISRFFN